ncbi:MAG: hypothetical protein ACOYKN_15590 [Pirellula sp.]
MQLRSLRAGWQFHRVINADRASSSNSLRAGLQLRSPAGQLAVVIHGELVGIPSSNQRRLGQQLRSMQDGLYFHRVTNSETVCSCDPWEPG